MGPLLHLAVIVTLEPAAALEGPQGSLAHGGPDRRDVVAA